MDANRYVYNVKVYPHDWFVVVRDMATNKGTVFHNNTNLTNLKAAFSQNGVYGGFGSKRYDQYIVQGVFAGLSPERIYELHKFISSGQMAWNFPELKNFRWRVQDTDLSDDASSSLSIDTIAGHLGEVIPEMPVDDNLDRYMTEDEIKAVADVLIHKNKVLAAVMNIREPYLNTKEFISNMANLGLNGLRYTNAKLCSVLMGAKKRSYNDARDYKYPSNLLVNYIPEAMFDFINKIYDRSLTDKQVFTGRNLVLNIGGCDITIANGGIHGAAPGYDSNMIPEGRIMVILDVSGFYPSLIIVNGYSSRSVSDQNIYPGIVRTRKEAKAAGNTKVSDPLKTVVNTYFGAMLAPNNDLYDPLMGRSTIYSGQLYLVELLNHLATDIKDLKVVMGNTDGFTIECSQDDLSAVFEIVNEWQNRTGLVLEQDKGVKRLVQKNVNNYIEVKGDGSLKLTGELKRGVEQKTGFRVNNNAPVICDAVINYVLNGSPIEETILNCSDIKRFQYITNTGNSGNCFTIINGQTVELGPVNRIYASKDTRADTVYVSSQNGRICKIKDIPEHCVIDNNNQLSVNDIDVNHYISVACKLAESYIGHEVIARYVEHDRFDNIDSAEIEIGDLGLDEDIGSRPSVTVSPLTESLNKLYDDYSNGNINEKTYNESVASIMPSFIKESVSAYKGSSLPESVSAELAYIQRQFLPTWITDSMINSGSIRALYDTKGTKICTGFSKVLITPYGSFIEMPRNMVCIDNISVYPGEEYRLAPENRGKVTSYIYKSNSDASCRINLCAIDDNTYGFSKSHAYVSVNEVVDASLYREFSDDPIIKNGLDSYGAASLYSELSAEDDAPFESLDSSIVEDLKDGYCIYQEQIDGVDYICQCHIYSNPDNSSYLNIMRIPYDEAVGYYRTSGNMDATENLIFMNAQHKDVLVSSPDFSDCISYIRDVADKEPDSLIDSGSISDTLKNMICDQRGDMYGVLQ